MPEIVSQRMILNPATGKEEPAESSAAGATSASVIAGFKARIEHMMERERFFAEKLDVPSLGAMREDWIAAIAKHDEKVARDALGQVYANLASGGASGLDDLTPEEIALCRAIEAISAALGNADPVVDIGEGKHAPGVKHLRVLRREITACTPCSGKPENRPRELRILLDQMRFLAEQVYRTRVSDRAALVAETPQKLAALDREMKAISRALSLPDGPVPTTHQIHNDRSNDGRWP